MSNPISCTLYDCEPSLNQFLHVDKLLNNFLLLGTGKNPKTSLFCNTIKYEKKFWRKENYKKCKINKTISSLWRLCKRLHCSCFEFFYELQLKNAQSAIKNKLKDLITELTGYKCVTTLVLKFKKRESNDATKYSNFYSDSKTIINESYTDDVFELIYGTTPLNI